jgi:TolB-like protein
MQQPDPPDENGEPLVKQAALNSSSFIEWRTAALFMVVLTAAVVLWFEPWSERRVEPAAVERMVSPLPDKPSIAVMPFANLSDDQNQESLIDGMTEDLIIDMSRMPALFVAARDPVFEYKGRKYRIRDVAENLSVGYVLEGGVRRAGVRLRVEVELIDALSGEYVWAENFDGVLDDVPALRARIAQDVLQQLTTEQ